MGTVTVIVLSSHIDKRSHLIILWLCRGTNVTVLINTNDNEGHKETTRPI